MLAAFAAFEREVGGERTKAALGHLRAQGLKYSAVAPLGFRFDGDKLVEDQGEQKALRLILRAKKEGVSLRATAAALVDAGCMGRDGKAWGLGAIRGVLRRAAA